MSITILTPGLQATVQAGPRRGYRHMGVPWSGPADPLSHALANRLVGNTYSAAAIEITLGGFACQVDAEITIALAGALAPASLNDVPAPYHQTLTLRSGDRLHLTPPARGVRTYLAVAGGIIANEILGSASTYLPARLGGFQGRALSAGDEIEFRQPAALSPPLTTPVAARPHIARTWALRTCTGAEFDQLDDTSKQALFETDFPVSRRADRMGIMLDGPRLQTSSDGKMKSAPVFPGTIQCPEHGQPIILGCDAQTTGGYPRIASVARCDRHMLGQIRPGDRVRFLRRSPEQAAADLSRKGQLFQDWLPDFRF